MFLIKIYYCHKALRKIIRDNRNEFKHKICRTTKTKIVWGDYNFVEREKS